MNQTYVIVLGTILYILPEAMIKGYQIRKDCTANGIVAMTRFWETMVLIPSNSATMNAIAKSQPPLPWFQSSENESGW